MRTAASPQRNVVVIYSANSASKLQSAKISDVQSGPDAGGFTADLEWIDENGTKLLTEARKTTIRKTPTLRSCG